MGDVRVGLPKVVKGSGGYDYQSRVDLGGDKLACRPRQRCGSSAEVTLARVQEAGEELGARPPGPITSTLQIGTGSLKRRSGLGVVAKTYLGDRDCGVGLAELMQSTQLLLSLERGRRSGKRAGGIGPGQQLDLVGSGVGQPDHSARPLDVGTQRSAVWRTGPSWCRQTASYRSPAALVSPEMRRACAAAIANRASADRSRSGQDPLAVTRVAVETLPMRMTASASRQRNRCTLSADDTTLVSLPGQY